MDKFIRHIEHLLIKNDFVIVPNLGGFIIQTQSARITEKKITPPCSTVGFNPLMQDHDGLLALSISNAESISYREALKIIDTETKRIKICLQQEKQFKFGKLGVLYLNNENQISFEPTAQLSLLPVNFGLKPVYTNKYQRKQKKSITITLPSNKVYRYAAVILLLLGIFLFSPSLNDSALSDYASLVPSVTLTQSIQEADNNLKENALLTNQTEEEKGTKPEALQQDIQLKEYHIVVACFPDRQSAEQYCNQLKKKNNENAKVLPSIKTNRVIIESFHDRNTAVSYMRNLRNNNYAFKDAWLHQE